MRIYGCVDDYISLEDLCDFVMEMFGSRGRRRVHSTEALESLRYKNSDPVVWRESQRYVEQLKPS